MLFGELGRLPVEIIIYRRMVCYWARLLSGKQLKFSALLYKVMFNDYIVNGTEYKWIITIKTIWITWGWVIFGYLKRLHQ